jgi:dephospho-CoA kinase
MARGRERAFCMEEGRKPLVVGVVGGIGSGKSQVTRLLAEAGAQVISGDALGHEALRQPDIKEQVVRRWGAGLLDESGAIERKKLGGIVFADPTELRALEEMVHPWIKRRIREEIEAARGAGILPAGGAAGKMPAPQAPLIVLDAAIMLEAGWGDVCDVIVFVDVPRDIRLERIARQRGWTEKEVAAREEAQWPLADKRARADIVLDNSGSPADLNRQVDALLARWGVPRLSPVKDS